MPDREHTHHPKRPRGHLRLADDSAPAGGASETSGTSADHSGNSRGIRRVRTVDPTTGRTALITSSIVPPGSVLSVTVIDPQGSGDERSFKLRSLDWQTLQSTQDKIRRYLVAGHLPAAML